MSQMIFEIFMEPAILALATVFVFVLAALGKGVAVAPGFLWDRAHKKS